ncbi:MAG: ubiquinone/menaquinone biosynthesis methyltransferase [Solirubrobacteraceae bacterium]
MDAVWENQPGAERGTLSAIQVRAMFDRVARPYDLLNTVMTAGLHHAWRRRAADLALTSGCERVLDIAAGTGDLTIEIAGRLPDGEVIGCDFSEQMLVRARAKAPGLCFQFADALALPYADDEFDVATVGFGARNFANLEAGMSEMARVVRPGGRVVILDFATPQRAPLSSFFALWFDRVVPILGHLVKARDAYSYLANSVRRYPDPHQIAALMERCGVHNIRYVVIGGGIVTLHTGEVSG